MKLYDRFMETCDRLDDEDAFWGKIIFYATSLLWIVYLKTFIHELGHAVVAIALGGIVTEFVMNLNGGGHVQYIPPIDILPFEYIVLNTLFLVSGGIAAMLLFIALSYKTKWFLIPATLSLLDGFLEALYMKELRSPLITLIILTSWWAIGMLMHGVIKRALEPIGTTQGNHIPKGALRR